MNHVHLGTKDLARSCGFYEKYFGFRKEADHGDGAFLRDEKGFLIAVDPVSTLPELPGWFHLGFCLDAPEKVKAVHEKMKADGVEFTRDIREFGDDAVSFFCKDPDGYKIEVSWHRS